MFAACCNASVPPAQAATTWLKLPGWAQLVRNKRPKILLLERSGAVTEQLRCRPKRRQYRRPLLRPGLLSSKITPTLVGKEPWRVIPTPAIMTERRSCVSSSRV